MSLKIEQMVECPYCGSKQSRIINFTDKLNKLKADVLPLNCVKCCKPFITVVDLKLNVKTGEINDIF